jgi:hypothetical protein
MSYNIIEGTTIRFFTTTPFTSFNGTVVTPDTVTFTYEIQGQTPVTFTWTNPSGDHTGTIVNTATGTFYANIPTTGKAGVWTWQWAGFSSSGLDSTATTVVAEGSITVSPSSVS